MGVLGGGLFYIGFFKGYSNECMVLSGWGYRVSVALSGRVSSHLSG